MLFRTITWKRTTPKASTKSKCINKMSKSWKISPMRWIDLADLRKYQLRRLTFTPKLKSEKIYQYFLEVTSVLQIYNIYLVVCSLCITAYICCLVYTLCIDLTCLPGMKNFFMPGFTRSYCICPWKIQGKIYKSFKIMYCIVYQPKIVAKNGNEKNIYLLYHSAQKKHNPSSTFLTLKRKLS